MFFTELALYLDSQSFLVAATFSVDKDISSCHLATMLFVHASSMNDEGEEQRTQIFLAAIDFIHIGCIM